MREHDTDETYDTGDTRPCPTCGLTLEHGGYSPDGEPEWFHVDSYEDVEAALAAKCEKTP